MITDQLRTHWRSWLVSDRRKILAHSPAAKHAAAYIDEVLAGTEHNLKPYIPGLKCELRLVTEEAQAFVGGDPLEPEIIAAKAVQRALESLLSPYNHEDVALAMAAHALIDYLRPLNVNL